MAYTAEEVVSLLDSSFQGADSSDDDLGFEIEEVLNPYYMEQGNKLQYASIQL